MSTRSLSDMSSILSNGRFCSPTLKLIASPLANAKSDAVSKQWIGTLFNIDELFSLMPGYMSI